MATKTAKVELKIGAVAYPPKVIAIWEGMREYLSLDPFGIRRIVSGRWHGSKGRRVERGME